MTNDTTPPPKPKPPRGNQFQKGDDPRRAKGNLAKRTKDGKTVTSLAREFTEEALMKQVEIMRDPATPAREALKASENIISRGWGAAKQQIEMTANVEHTHTVSRIDWANVTLEARMNLLANIQTLPAPDLIEDAQFSITDRTENDDTDDR